MTAILWITLFLIILYLSYPVWLSVTSPDKISDEIETDDIDQVTVILLSFNGKTHLAKKINFLLRKLSHFKHHELIIVDDYSTDGSEEILASFKQSPNVKIISKNSHKGIPDSMNLGVSIAKYENIIFCDQRQKLSDESLKGILIPLKYKNVGAVSGCITNIDSEQCDSVIRRHENYIKSKESKLGSLMGVYGPFYAIKKACYTPIPNHIILDDLYLSLRILKSKQIILIRTCSIIDDCSSTLYNYNRAKRYLKGFNQLLFEKGLISNLKFKKIAMLFWHKYLRLIIPLFLFFSYIATTILIPEGSGYLVLFIIMSLCGVIAILQMIYNFRSRLINIVRVNIYYIIAFFDLPLNNCPGLRFIKNKMRRPKVQGEKRLTYFTKT